jgi:HD-GYP domain-containing protein (c-di-GMP phosphodiesterase class II)
MDLVSAAVVDHNHRVAYMAMGIARQMGLSREEVLDILYAGMLHDAGALSLADELDEFYYDLNDPHQHAEVGYQLLREYEPLSGVAGIIRHHHVPWRDGEGRFFSNREVPYASHIIHLAERICSLIDEKEEILGQRAMFDLLVSQNKGDIFAPDIADAFLSLSRCESFWFEVTSRRIGESLADVTVVPGGMIDKTGIFAIAQLFYEIIDFRSRYTMNHSSGVAVVSEALALAMGMDADHAQDIKVAGYLHDLGKLVVPRKILEKPGRLSDHEFNVIKGHSYETHNILKNLAGFDKIAVWASFHHERLDGKGYPFHMSAGELPMEARIVAAADVFGALKEDRPYREGLKQSQIMQILNQMTAEGAIDGDCVSVIGKTYDEIEGNWKESQEKVSAKYRRIGASVSGDDIESSAETDHTKKA